MELAKKLDALEGKIAPEWIALARAAEGILPGIGFNGRCHPDRDVLVCEICNGEDVIGDAEANDVVHDAGCPVVTLRDALAALAARLSVPGSGE